MSAKAREPSPPSQTHSRTSSDTHTTMTLLFRDELSVNKNVGHIKANETSTQIVS